VTPDTEERLRDAFAALAEQVEVDPDAYARAQREWRRRERRRRLLVVLLAVLLVAAADLIGLWALSQAGGGHPVVFDAPAPVPMPPPAAPPGP
jgi:ferric-dicitrate binding protein FerR (iron transport regulator)